MAASAVVLATLPGTIVGAYVATGDPANRVLVALALQFLVIAAIFQIVDGIQVVAAGALRGYQDTAVPMLLAGARLLGDRLRRRLGCSPSRSSSARSAYGGASYSGWVPWRCC